jgi:hypothetical protein
MQMLFNMSESSSFSHLLSHHVFHNYGMTLLTHYCSARIYVFNVSGLSGQSGSIILSIICCTTLSKYNQILLDTKIVYHPTLVLPQLRLAWLTLAPTADGLAPAISH